MLKREDNERITRTGPGTPMGEVFRRYWIPALLSEELPEPDCPPVRVRLLGEDLVAFRDSSGRVGLLDAYCPHRRAHLFWGRNEECGLRCVYHGWKFDVEGRCVDMPNEPPESNFKHKVRTTAYPCWEGGGVVWTYMGPPELQPQLPDYEWLRAPATHRYVSKTFEDCNYLQALEGGIDTSHSSFAHNNNLQDKKALRTRAPAPKLEVYKTSYGFQYVGLRDLGEDGLYVRAYQFIMPFQQMRGYMTNWSTGEPEKYPSINGHIWVPVDDYHCVVYNWMYSAYPDKELPLEYCIEHETLFGRGPNDVMPDNKYRLIRNRSNDYLIDRQVQKTKTFTGIQGINTQDFALQETMEPIVDRSKERLGSADAAIIVARQLLLEATRDVEAGKMPRGTDPEAYRNVRGCDHIIPKGVAWQEALKEELTARY
ncbi:MAG: Rieske 2Fe-2S domain-containing protein [Alicyclobacillus macrosporangiidus]|uniref:Rieske 2Fe-2S domain-containing protein n=1 Tax=Alicyclobacillus macrosporangiidus TaxID=392015 RepID=UPI0026F15444|nr:Rieske 2Fe-2S domain-containing protein [Alicyclobacillus macrosporangiidus]MCL6598140.1 Rieske 2Fe-2S domain-containing protein [Alicyclobacillus macrosporangiidus]